MVAAEEPEAASTAKSCFQSGMRSERLSNECLATDSEQNRLSSSSIEKPALKNKTLPYQ